MNDTEGTVVEIEAVAVTRADQAQSVAPPRNDSEEVTSLVKMAIDKNVPVEVLERLVALQERVTERNARAAFFDAMTAFRTECPPIPKTRINSQFEVTRNGTKVPAKYAALEDIDRIARPVAAARGLAWTWNTDVQDGMMRVTCRVTHIEGHAEETTVTMPCESKAGSSLQQKYGSAQTYGMRYSLVAALGLTTADDDADGNAARSDAEVITQEEAANLDDMAEAVGVNRKKFLDWLEVATFAEVPKSKLRAAIDALEEKRKKKAEAE